MGAIALRSLRRAAFVPLLRRQGKVPDFRGAVRLLTANEFQDQMKRAIGRIAASDVARVVLEIKRLDAGNGHVVGGFIRLVGCLFQMQLDEPRLGFF